jgi:hypothetical protein
MNEAPFTDSLPTSRSQVATPGRMVIMSFEAGLGVQPLATYGQDDQADATL